MSLYQKDSFLLYTQQQELVEQLSNEQAGELFKSLYKYVSTGEVAQMDALTKMAFIALRQNLDRNAEKYEEKREKLRLNGIKGGRPKKEIQEEETDEEKENQKNQMVFSKTKKSLYDNVNVNENENENVLSLSDEERELIKNYVKRKKLAKKNLNAYVSKIIQNGDHIEILKEEREKLSSKKDLNIEEMLKSITDKKSAAKVLYSFYANGGFPPAEFDEVMEKYDLVTYDKLFEYGEELAKQKSPPT